MRLFLFLFFLGMGNVFATSILDLRQNVTYVRSGFDKDWSVDSKSLENSTEWLKVSQGFGKNHSLASRHLNLPHTYHRSFLSLDGSPEESFSYVFHFSLEESIYEKKNTHALYLASVGTRWKVYVNGILVEDRLSDGKNNARFQYILPIPSEALRVGENSVLFHIQGPRSSHLTGFYKSDEILFGNYEELSFRKKDLIAISLSLIYFVIFSLYFVLYLRKPDHFYNLLYALFTGSLSIYIASFSNAIHFFVKDSSLAYRIQIISFVLLPLFGIIFFRSVFGQKLSKFDTMMIPLSFCLILGSMIFSISWLFDVSQTYKFFLPTLSFYALISIIGKEFKNDFLNLWNSIPNQGKEKNKSVSRVAFHTISNTVSGNLFFATSLFNILLVIDIIDSLLFVKVLFLSQYGFIFFVFGIAYALSNRYLRISNKNSELNHELEIKLKELGTSDRKYKFLVDGTTDLLFVMGPGYEIRSMNQAARKYFGVKPELLVGKNFMDLLYTTSKDHAIVSQLVEENLRSLDSPGKQVKFRARIRTSRMQEPLEFSFRLEAVESEDHLEYIGKATSSLDENLTGYIIEETQVYQIENYILMAEELSHRIVRVLKKKLPEYRVDAIRTGLREILVNSIEHGNLNISFEEKSQHLSKGDYLQLISNRQKDPVYKKRKVQVVYTLTDTFVSYHITDEGEGFDYGDLMKKAFANQALGREHGRGIMLAESIFDTVEFLGSGNSVYLKVNF